ncbi:MAG: P-II family nitrogen regulator [Chloroflexota bacterium]|nr:P-II family nitrogen regulator [Chloroflexota bacterium]
MKKIEAIIRPEALEPVKRQLIEAGITGLHVERVAGHGYQGGIVQAGRGGQFYTVDMIPKVKIITVISDFNVEPAIDAIIAGARTDNTGDGKIFVTDVEEAVRVSTRESGRAGL